MLSSSKNILAQALQESTDEYKYWAPVSALFKKFKTLIHLEKQQNSNHFSSKLVKTVSIKIIYNLICVYQWHISIFVWSDVILFKKTILIL